MPKVFCSYSELVETKEIKKNPKNPNVHPKEQIKQLAKIISETGWRAPITVSKRSGLVTKGHGRLEAAKLRKWKKVPVDFQKYKNEAEEIADMLADNKIAELSEMDSELELFHKQELIEADFDLELAGFDFDSEEDEGDDDGKDSDSKESTVKEVKFEDDCRIEIKCKNEQEQEEFYNQLTEMGFECRVLKL